MNTRQAMQLVSVIQNNVDWDSIEPKTAQEIIDNPAEAGGRFTDFIRSGAPVLPVVAEKSLDLHLSSWASLYKEMGIDLDVANLKVPEPKPGFDRLIIVAQGMTPNRAYEECAKRFPCWKYADDLDTAVPTNDRDPSNSTYALWVRDRVEADEELKNKSANDLKEEDVKGITLLERIFYELKYHNETGKHLDLENVTLCSGSRHSDGHVPYAYWLDGRFDVIYYDADYHNPSLRSRAVVSL
ncbi:MAG: hypothetical protein AAB538_00895 [Patescibacteria group bacterium]